MATQTVEFNATTGLTITAKLFALGSDTVAASVVATEKTNDKGRYEAEFTNVAAGEYRLNGFVGSTGGYVNEIYDLTLSTDTFFPRSETIKNTSIALEVFKKLIGSSIAVATVPTSSNLIDIINNVDFDLSISIVSTSGARLIFSIGCPADDEASLEADSITGLITINGEASGSPTLAAITRESDSLVSVLIKAEAINELGTGGFVLELREVVGSATTSLWEANANIRKTSGRITA